MALHAYLFPNRAADPAREDAIERAYQCFGPAAWAGARAESWYLGRAGRAPGAAGRRRWAAPGGMGLGARAARRRGGVGGERVEDGRLLWALRVQRAARQRDERQREPTQGHRWGQHVLAMAQRKNE
ncbi:hypothetical protein NHJ13051_007132 [Beauveria bassiana]